MDRNRPVEAAAAFAVAAQSPLPRTRADAAYGETLADLRSEVTDRAAVSAAQEPQSEKRSVEMTIALLAQQATAAYTDGRYAETIILLNERARYTPETNDLLVLKGFSYMKLGQLASRRQAHLHGGRRHRFPRRLQGARGGRGAGVSREVGGLPVVGLMRRPDSEIRRPPFPCSSPPA
jgi:hypothetical protein